MFNETRKRRYAGPEVNLLTWPRVLKLIFYYEGQVLS
jgi:hypothetical protein